MNSTTASFTYIDAGGPDYKDRNAGIPCSELYSGVLLQGVLEKDHCPRG